MSRLVFFIMAFYLSVPMMAQKVKHVKAEYTYVSDNRDESLRQAEERAFFKARCRALAEEFGATVGGRTDIETVNEDGQTSVRFRQRGGTELRADWLKTIKEEVRGRSVTDEGFMVITVYVEGMAREITMAGIDFECHVLRNGNTLADEDDRFRNGDRLKVMFKSPVNGYLALYLTDDERAYCMLPYKEQTDGVYQVKANKQYVFFSEQYAPAEEKSFDIHLKLLTDKKSEKNTICIVFSQNPFTKKADNEGDRISNSLVMARNIALDDFEDWLYRCQRKDSSMRVEKKEIMITK